MAVLHFQQSGSPSNPSIVLIHGLFGSLENLNMVAKGLNEHFHVTNLDVRNHGLSFHENNMDYHALAQDVIETLDQLDITRTHILGHSMGGKIAMQVALEHSARVDKLVVADISPVRYPPHHNQIIDGLLSIDVKNIQNRKQADEQLARFVTEPGIRQFLLRNLTKVDDQMAFKCNLEFIANNYHQIVEGYEGNQTFNNPTLFVKGGNSDYINAEHQSLIAQLFPQSKAKIIQNAGHWLHAEKTTAFNKIVADFLAS